MLPTGSSGVSCSRPLRVARMNNRRRPSWSWCHLQSDHLLAAPSKTRCASHGIRSRVCPAVDKPAARPLPATLPPHSAQPPPGDQVSLRRWFLTTSTVYSAQRPRVCCIPKPTGVHCVSPCTVHFFPHVLKTRSCRRTSRQPMALNTTPRNAVHTLQRIPLASSRTASPRPLPS